MDDKRFDRMIRRFRELLAYERQHPAEQARAEARYIHSASGGFFWTVSTFEPLDDEETVAVADLPIDLYEGVAD